MRGNSPALKVAVGPSNLVSAVQASHIALFPAVTMHFTRPGRTLCVVRRVYSSNDGKGDFGPGWRLFLPFSDRRGAPKQKAGGRPAEIRA